MAAELVENARKFIGDIAAADNHHPLGRILKMKGFVGRDAMLRSFHFRDRGPGPRRDKDVSGADFTAA